MQRCLSIILLLATTFFCTSQLSAQSSNLRSKRVATHGMVALDSLSIVPGTFSFSGIDTTFFSLNVIEAKLQWLHTLPTDSITVTYRVFPSKLTYKAHGFTYDSVRNNFIAEKPKAVTNSSPPPLINFGKLNYNGSFGRSLSVGNTQDAVFNSQLNLQIDGLIGDSVQIAAAISDNNIPIQPDGTTQQLNEFDKILLQFSKQHWSVSLGDIDLRTNDSYFIKFYKRLQGISYAQHYTAGKQLSADLMLSGAIAKGKFARNILPVQEGNQGPYRLQGNNNELYFVVLAGTEKVFVDGVQLQRGEDGDYIINYNTAEVTFTPRQMITKDKRVQVEFEYADRNYLNSMLYGSNKVTVGKKLSLFISAYSNRDAKSSPINQTLDNNQKLFLAGIGDSIQNAYYPMAGADSFSASKILYKKIDTVYNNIHDSIYVYSSSADSAHYDLSFVEVGYHKGNYLPSYAAANGKVYQWVAPVDGVPQGSYEAAAFLATPKQQQLISVGADYKIDDRTTLSAEVAASRYDVNTFSQKDKADNTGFAGKLLLQQTRQWTTTKQKQLQLTGKAGYEWVSKEFRPIERLRAVEFARDWGLPLLTAYADEQLPSVSIELRDDKSNKVQYQFGSYLRSDGYKGYRNIVNQMQDWKGFHVISTFNLTNISLPGDKGFYLRPSVDVGKTMYQLHNLVAGASYALEHNEIRHGANDTVTPVSFAFETVSAYLKSDQAKANKWMLSYFTRSNKLPDRNTLSQTDRSHNYNLQAELLQNANHQVRVNVTYRQLYVTNEKLIDQQSDNSLLGRVEYAINEWRGLVTGNILYEIGSGQEQRRDYSYIEVPAGLGQYTWNDYNSDGIQQLNEFELALYQDQAKFIRIFTPTNQYLKANYNQFTYNFSINPKGLSTRIANRRLQTFVSRLNLLSSLQAAQKQVAGEHPLYNPLRFSESDSSLLTLNYIISNTLSLNRSSSVWGAEVTQLSNFNKALLTYGFESRQLQQWNSKAHLNLKKVYTIELSHRTGTNKLSTPSFANRNYAIIFYSLQPKISYTAGTKFRVQAGYEYVSNENEKQYGGEKSISQSVLLESRFNAVSNTSINAKLTVNNISYTGVANTTTSYIMLGGLLPGKNYLWNLSFTKRLINNLELNFEYEGRRPGNGRTVNIGRASVRALL